MAPHLGASSVENLLRIGEEVVAHIDAFVGGK
jgi:phosphoglycerate dehydrogenase-like enzyme